MLSYYAVLKDKTEVKIDRVFSAVLDCDLSVPADSLKVASDCSRFVAENIVEIKARENGNTVFSGIVDSVVSTQSKASRSVVISARSAAALLLDNEAEPLSYNRPSPEFISRKHLLPFGITLADGGKEVFGGSFRVYKGMSHWQVVESFCRTLYGTVPVITADSRAYLKSFPNNGSVVFGSGETEYFSLTEKRNPGVLLSDIRVKSTPDGRYYSVVSNLNPEASFLTRRRFVDVSAANRSMETVIKMLKNCNRKSYSAELKCIGCRVSLLGKSASVKNGNETIDGLTVRGTRFTEDKNGAVTTITLEKEWS